MARRPLRARFTSCSSRSQCGFRFSIHWMETMYPQEPALFDKHTIETPEQLRLNFAVAGIGSRFLALAIDTLIQIGVALAAFVALLILSFTGVRFGGGQSSVWLIALIAAFFFLLFFGYFAVFEIVWNGQ